MKKETPETKQMEFDLENTETSEETKVIVPSENTIVTDLETAQELKFGKRDLNTYQKLTEGIEKGFTKASEAYVVIACGLWQVQKNEYFRIDNYKSIAEYALELFEIKKSTTHNYIKVIDKFGEIENGKAKGLKEEFKAYKCSQLINMLSFTPEQIEGCSPEWSVRRIIDYGKSSLPMKEDATETEDADNQEELEENDFSEKMHLPEIESSSVRLAEFHQFSELEKQKDLLDAAYADMKSDPNFKDKNIRFVIELIYD